MVPVFATCNTITERKEDQCAIFNKTLYKFSLINNPIIPILTKEWQDNINRRVKTYTV